MPAEVVLGLRAAASATISSTLCPKVLPCAASLPSTLVRLEQSPPVPQALGCPLRRLVRNYGWAAAGGFGGIVSCSIT
jgi:hypothetical protein